MPALNRALARPLRTFVWLGVSLGVLLGAGLVVALVLAPLATAAAIRISLS